LALGERKGFDEKTKQFIRELSLFPPQLLQSEAQPSRRRECRWEMCTLRCISIRNFFMWNFSFS